VVDEIERRTASLLGQGTTLSKMAERAFAFQAKRVAARAKHVRTPLHVLNCSDESPYTSGVSLTRPSLHVGNSTGAIMASHRDSFIETTVWERENLLGTSTACPSVGALDAFFCKNTLVTPGVGTGARSNRERLETDSHMI